MNIDPKTKAPGTFSLKVERLPWGSVAIISIANQESLPIVFGRRHRLMRIFNRLIRINTWYRYFMKTNHIK
jgi:hypothetical protein